MAIREAVAKIEETEKYSVMETATFFGETETTRIGDYDTIEEAQAIADELYERFADVADNYKVEVVKAENLMVSETVEEEEKGKWVIEEETTYDGETFNSYVGEYDDYEEANKVANELYERYVDVADSYNVKLAYKK